MFCSYLELSLVNPIAFKEYEISGAGVANLSGCHTHVLQDFRSGFFKCVFLLYSLPNDLLLPFVQIVSVTCENGSANDGFPIQA